MSSDRVGLTPYIIPITFNIFKPCVVNVLAPLKI